MTELEHLIKVCGEQCDGETELPVTLDMARDVMRKLIAARQTLRRIVSLDEKNVPKFAQDIAKDGLRQSN